MPQMATLRPRGSKGSFSGFRVAVGILRSDGSFRRSSSAKGPGTTGSPNRLYRCFTDATEGNFEALGLQGLISRIWAAAGHVSSDEQRRPIILSKIPGRSHSFPKPSVLMPQRTILRPRGSKGWSDGQRRPIIISKVDLPWGRPLLVRWAASPDNYQQSRASWGKPLPVRLAASPDNYQQSRASWGQPVLVRWAASPNKYQESRASWGQPLLVRWAASPNNYQQGRASWGQPLPVRWAASPDNYQHVEPLGVNLCLVRWAASPDNY